MGIFRLAGDTSARSKVSLLKSNEAKKRFLDEVRALLLPMQQVYSVEFYRVINEDLDDFLTREHVLKVLEILFHLSRHIEAGNSLTGKVY